MINYSYITACWLYYDVVHWYFDSILTATYILPYWFLSNFAVETTGYHVGEYPVILWGDITYRMSVYPCGVYTPLLTYLWYLNYMYSYAYFGSYLPELNEFWNIYWYFGHFDYWWWKGVLALEDHIYYVWKALLVKPSYFLVIWEF